MVQDDHLDFHTAPELRCGQYFFSMLLYVHRDRKDYSGRGAHEGHLDFHTAPERGWVGDGGGGWGVSLNLKLLRDGHVMVPSSDS